MRKSVKILLRWFLAVLLAISGSGFFELNIFYIVFSWWTFYMSYFVISLFHESVSAFGNIILVGERVVEIIPACVAASAYLLLALFILLTKGISFRKGVYMFFLGSVLILAANLIRIEVLVYLLVKGNVNYFETVHLLFWKILSSVYVAMVWIFLCWKFKIKEIPVLGDVKFFLKK